MFRGTVKFYKQKEGWGFISRENNKQDIFFHYTGLLDKNSYPQQNDEVEFEIADGWKGKQKAVKVKRIVK